MMASLRAARARVAAEDSLKRRVRLALRALWDAANQLESSTNPTPPDPTALAALRKEAVRLACQAVPFPALADTADARVSLSRLVEQGLDGVPPGEVAHVLMLAQEAHSRALDALEVDVREEQRLVRGRQLALGSFAVMVCLVASLVGQWLMRSPEPLDLAKGKPFTLSSKWADCHPEQNECGKYPTRVAFHTNHQVSPWYQVDLGEPTTFSSATIINRQDAAMGAALPLVLEASDDGKTFRELARRTEAFTHWQPTFPPQTARYFRARVDRTSTLHLEAVRVHP